MCQINDAFDSGAEQISERVRNLPSHRPIIIHCLALPQGTASTGYRCATNVAQRNTWSPTHVKSCNLSQVVPSNTAAVDAFGELLVSLAVELEQAKRELSPEQLEQYSI